MRTRIVPHSPELKDAVEAFNLRMREGGSKWGFYPQHECDWIPRRPGRRVWRDYYLAVDDDGTVRGGYALKPQPWLIDGQERVVADWQGPFSEGAISNQYAAMGLRMVRDMAKKQPLLYSWGHGGNDEPLIRMLSKMGWLLHPTPFCLYVHRPRRFLRHNAYLRRTPERRLALDALAWSGAGNIGLHGLHAAIAARAAARQAAWRRGDVEVEVFQAFGPWADALWERVRERYTAIAIRDADIMNTLLPQGGWPKAIRLRMHRKGDTVGWAAVMDTQMTEDARFGTLRVGSIVDCLAAPEDASAVVRGAKRFLCERGVDIVISNQSHPGWLDAFERNGFYLVRDRRMFAAAPALKTMLEPFETRKAGLHLTNMDGHGPHLL